MKNLECDEGAAPVPRAKHPRAAAAPDFRLDRVSPGERALNGGEEITGHQSRISGRTRWRTSHQISPSRLERRKRTRASPVTPTRHGPPAATRTRASTPGMSGVEPAIGETLRTTPRIGRPTAE